MMPWNRGKCGLFGRTANPGLRLSRDSGGDNEHMLSVDGVSGRHMRMKSPESTLLKAPTLSVSICKCLLDPLVFKCCGSTGTLPVAVGACLPRQAAALFTELWGAVLSGRRGFPAESCTQGSLVPTRWHFSQAAKGMPRLAWVPLSLWPAWCPGLACPPPLGTGPGCSPLRAGLWLRPPQWPPF